MCFSLGLMRGSASRKTRRNPSRAFRADALGDRRDGPQPVPRLHGSRSVDRQHNDRRHPRANIDRAEKGEPVAHNNWTIAGLALNFVGVVGLAVIPEHWGIQGLGRRMLVGEAGRAGARVAWALVALGILLQLVGHL